MRGLGTLLVGIALALAIAQPATANDRGTLERYARATWASFAAMTDEQSAACPPTSSKPTARTSVQTSTTNIGAYMWSAVVAERLGIIGHARGGRAAGRRRSTSLEHMERHEPSGQFYNWYDHRTGAKLTLAADRRRRYADPVLGRQRLARRRPAGRRERACPSCRRARRRSTTRWTSASTTGRTSTGSSSTTRPTTGEAPCCYDTIVSESRIATYIGIAKGELPPKAVLRHAGARSRTPATGAGRRRSRSASTRTYFGVDRLRGRATRTTACGSRRRWGGSMFEALMPALFVPEERWAPRSWGVNHPLTVARADPPRAASRPATATGASRRRTCPRAATTPTASTRSA